MDKRLVVISLPTENLSRSVHFYRDVLGLTLVTHHGDRPHFDLEGCYLVLLERPAEQHVKPGEDRFPKLALAVNALDSLIERLESHKVELPWGIESDGHSRWVMFYDPGGNLIELVQISIQGRK